MKPTSSKSGKVSFENKEEINLKEVPIEFIQSVLTLLEHFDLMKMCLLLCNSFKLNDLIGRYVVSSCLKYSNLATLRYTAKFELLSR